MVAGPRRILVSSGSPMEPEIGMSRAVRIGDMIAVAGTAPILPDELAAFRGDVYRQTQLCLSIVKKAIEDAGASLHGVIRTRVMLTDISRWKEAARAHGEMFVEVKPACTFVEVVRFIHPEWLVEIEADCVAPPSE